MQPIFSRLALVLWLGGISPALAGITPEQAAKLPPPADHAIDFTREIKPIFEASCIKCHGRGRDKGSLQIDSRETLLKGGDTGPAIVPGKSVDSLLIELVQGFDPDNAMPKKGTKLTPTQIGLLRAWIDQGAKWDSGITFGRLEPLNLNPREPKIPAGSPDANPIDLILQPYFVTHGIKPGALVSDRVFARRVYLDVIGLIPPPEALEKFVADKRADKRQRLVRALLADNVNYAQHWLTFWNDALRNDYRGTGYIDGGREQITAWLYSALATNMPYDRFVAELVNPIPASEGFTKGIVWRGVVNASQTPQMQAAQNISQVFMGVNLKCASCHDSFINDLTLADAYGLAGIYSDGPLEMVLCDKPTGHKAQLKFLYPELGAINSTGDRNERLKRLAEILTEKQDARLTLTLVNRFWQKFLGRGLVEPVDEMDKPAWNVDLADWLAQDFTTHHYDTKHLIEQILTSRAYQMPATSVDEKDSAGYVFRGPQVRRMSAEEFRDALGELTGQWYDEPAAQIDLTVGTSNAPVTTPFPAKWIWNVTNAATGTDPGTVYFRKTIQMSETPADAWVIAVADNSFTLFVNGKEVVSREDYNKLTVTDLRGKLVKGANQIAVKAINGGEKPNPAGLFVYVHARDSAGKLMDSGTDGSWVQTTNKVDGWEKSGLAATAWQPAIELGPISLEPWKLRKSFAMKAAEAGSFGRIRASLANADSLQVALGRPNREQTVTTRLSAATTLQALELTNGHELAGIFHQGAASVLAETGKNDLVDRLYERALGRKPTKTELKLATEVVGEPAQVGGVEDFLWGLAMLPEFQLIY